ncbi:M23 family metallopeptidase [bacterium]|nr:M23 family metallopeptidase [bacterium]
MNRIFIWLLILCFLLPASTLECGGLLKNLFRTREGQRERPGFWYNTQAGDTLFSLSKAYRVSIKDLKRVNRIEGNILPIRKIWIPRSTYDPTNSQLPHPHPRLPMARPVKKAPKSSRPKDREPPENHAREVIVKKEVPRFQWPVKDPILAKEGLFGAKPHETRNSGIMIQVAANIPVYPSRKGKTVFQGHLKGYGNTVILDHSDDYFTVYAHLGKISKLKDAQEVGPKQVIGYTKMSEKAHRPLLHFEVRHLNEPLDPLRFLNKEKAQIGESVETLSPAKGS